MNAAEIILLILGFLSISISFFVGKKEKNSDPSETAEYQSRDIWTEKEEAMVRGQIEAVLSEERENVIAETTDQLNRKSNEKIMEFATMIFPSEFDQLSFFKQCVINQKEEAKTYLKKMPPI